MGKGPCARSDYFFPIYLGLNGTVNGTRQTPEMATSVTFPLALLAFAVDLLSAVPCSAASSLGLRAPIAGSSALLVAVAGFALQVRSAFLHRHARGGTTTLALLRLFGVLCMAGLICCPCDPSPSAVVGGSTAPPAHSSHQRLADDIFHHAR